MKKGYYVLTFLPLILSVIALFVLPGEIPAHFNSSGEITRWGSKYEILICPVLILLFSFVLSLVYRLTPQENKAAVYKILLITLGILNCLQMVYVFVCIF